MLEINKTDNGTFVNAAKTTALKNVRASFPSLYHKPTIAGTLQDKFGIILLIPKDDAVLLAKLKKEIAAIQKDSSIKVPAHNICLKDGDESNRDEHKGYYVMSAKNRLQPRVLDGNKLPVLEDDCKIYAGCYINASIKFTIFKGSLGTFLSAQLNAVQFAKDGESFEGTVIVNEDDFDTIEDSKSTEDNDEDFLA